MRYIVINVPDINITGDGLYIGERLLFNIPADYRFDCIKTEDTSDIVEKSGTLVLVISSHIEDILYAAENSVANIYVNSASASDASYRAKYVLEDMNVLDISYIDEVISRHYGLPLTIGHTSRLTMRELSCEDMKLLYEQMSREGLYINNDSRDDDLATVLEKHKEYIRYQYGYYGFGYWGIFLKDTDILIGYSGFEIKNILPGTDAAEGGYYIMPEYRNQGYAYETFRYITELAKNSFDISSIYLVIENTNNASICLAEKLGYKRLENEVILRNSKDCFIFHN